MEKVETPHRPGSATSPTESPVGGTATGWWPHRRAEGLQIEAQATRWWAAYGGGAVSNR